MYTFIAYVFMYCNINETVYTLPQTHKISAEGNKMRSESILMRKGRRTSSREKVKAECDLFAKRASEQARTEQRERKAENLISKLLK